METVVQKPIVEEVSDLASSLVTKLTGQRKSRGEVVDIYDKLLPGFKERHANEPDLATIHTAFSHEAARLILKMTATDTIESLTEAIAKVKELRGLVEGSSVSSFATRIDDSTFALTVLGDPTQSQESHIYAKLGTDASYLIDELNSIGVQLDQGKVPKHSKAVLSSASNNKTYAEQKRFYTGGLASPYEAVNIAMEAVCAAKEAGIDLRTINGESWAIKGLRVESEAVAKGLDEAKVTVLKMLAEGAIRFDNGSRSGALSVDAHGRLHAHYAYALSFPNNWAFGVSPSAE